MSGKKTSFLDKFKKKEPPEDSIFLRALWLIQTLICFFLIALVDPGIAHVDFFGLRIPLLLIYFFTAVYGSYLSYYFRASDVKWLEWVGLLTIGISCNWFANNVQGQFNSGSEVDLLLPSVHLLAGLFVSHSFELRSRFDFNFSLVLSLILVGFASAIGKGAIFGLGLLLYIVLSAILLLLDCEAKTFGGVQERLLDSPDAFLKMNKQVSEKTANLFFPTLLLLFLSVCFFLFVPRAESLADHIAARVYAFLRNESLDSPHVKQLAKRIRSPYHFKAQPPDLQEKKKENPGKEYSRLAEKEKQKKLSMAKSTADASSSKGKSGEAESGGNANRAGGVDKQAQDKNRVGKNDSRRSADTDEENDKPGDGAKVGTADSTESEESNPAKSGDNSKGKSKDASAADAANSTAADKKLASAENEDAKKDSASSGSSKNKTGKSGGEKKRKSSDAYYDMDSMNSNEVAADGQEVLFEVACNRTVCFKQSVFDYFDGKSWTRSPGISEVKLTRAGNFYELKNIQPLKIGRTVPAIRLKQKYHISASLGPRFIFAANPTQLQTSFSTVFADSLGNLKAGGKLFKGLEYEVDSNEALYDSKSMSALAIPSESEEQEMRRGLKKFLQIPQNQSDELYDLSKEIAGLEDNWFVQAEKISSFLRHNYKYSKDPALKTKSKNTVDRFLFRSKAGDCKEFASSFVMLCRASGIPAKLVSGYTPGDFNPASGKRDVKLKNAHAWGEIYFPNYGWVPFDSTPESTMPLRELEEERYFTTIGQKVEASLKESRSNEAQGAVQILGHGTASLVSGLFELAKFLPLLIAFLLLSSPLFMFAKELLKKIKLPQKMHPASKVYCKLQKDLKLYGVETNESQTPGEFLSKVKEVICMRASVDEAETLAKELHEFIDSYNDVYFGSIGQVSDLEKKRERIKKLVKTN